MPISTAQITIVDLNDAIISGTKPPNPTVGTLWIDSSKTPNILYSWNGTKWVEQSLSLGGLDPSANDKLDKVNQSIIDMGSDSLLTLIERQDIRKTFIYMTGTISLTNTLPDLLAIDTAKLGVVYNIRQEARNANVATTHADYNGVETAYTALKAYAETLSPRPWDTTAKGTTPIVQATWSAKFKDYFESISKLQATITKAVNDNADNSIKPSKDYNGVKMDADNGLVITSTKNKTTLNATKGMEILRTSDSKVVFGVDSTTGNLTITGNINMVGGNITWASINAPTFAEVKGPKPDVDATNTYKDLTGNDDIKGIFTKNGTKLEVKADAITSGSLDAAKVKILNLDAGIINAGNLNVSAQQLLHETEFNFGTPKFWSGSTAYGTHWTIDNRTKFSSTNSLKIDISGLSALTYKAVYSEFTPTSEGETFTSSFYVFVSNLASIDKGIQTEIEFYDSAGTRSMVSKDITPKEVNKWIYVTHTATAPVNAVKTCIRFHATQNGQFWIARPMFQRGSVATQWQLHTDEDISVGAITADKIAAGSISADHMTVSTREVGLIGHYYKGANFDEYVGQQLDSKLEFSWNTGGPSILAPTVDYFSIRWQGYIYSKEKGMYTFTAPSADDGLKLVVNKSIVIDMFASGSGPKSGTVTLEADTWNPIVIEYCERAGGAAMIMKWRSPSDTSDVSIPAQNLRPGVTIFDGRTITTGKIKADLLQIGPDTIFEEGYDPNIAYKQMQDPFFDRAIMMYTTNATGKDVASLAGLSQYKNVSGAGSTGGSVLEATGPNRWVYAKHAIPIDIQKSYRVTFRVKQVATNGNNKNIVYAGVATLGGQYQNLSGGSGTHRYCAASSEVIKVEDGWRTYSGIISGIGDSKNNLRAGTVYVRPMMILNHEGDDEGIVHVDMLTFEDATAEVNANQFAIDAANRVSTKGLAMSEENVAGINKYLFHGYDVQGNPDKNAAGYLIVNGVKKTVPKAYLTATGMTGYIMYDDGNKQWYLANMGADKVWRRYNTGVAGDNQIIVLGANHYFVGYIEA